MRLRRDAPSLGLRRTMWYPAVQLPPRLSIYSMSVPTPARPNLYVADIEIPSGQRRDESAKERHAS